MFGRKRAGVTVDRRQNIRIEPPGVIFVSFDQPQRSLPNATVINISQGGAALRSDQAVEAGQRLSFSVGGGRPPVLAEVVECTKEEGESYFLRCRCVLGGFDIK